jgi:hypothetical protein
MKRVQLFEFEDFAWLPAAIRDGQTDYFSFGAQLSSQPYEAFARKLGEAMAATNDNTIVELGSGGGGQSLAIAQQLKMQVQTPRLVLTDLFPNLPKLRTVRDNKYGITVEVVETPVDATGVPANLKGFRLICNAFHHLSPKSAIACIADAVKRQQGIAIFELVGRSPAGFFQVISGSIGMFILMPFVKPFRLSRLFLTYLLPIIPLTTLWDGIASCLRVYSPDELKELVTNVPNSASYEWDIGYICVPKAPIKITYLIGRPKN